MKKLFFYSLVGALMFASCNSNNNQVNSGSESQQVKLEVVAKPTPPQSEGPVRVLFVGNSHTEYFASFPLTLEALAMNNDKEIEVSTLIKLGSSIDEILSANQNKADKIFAENDPDGNYFDYVILQESTPVAAQEEDHYKNDCKLIHDLVIKNSPDVATYIYELMMPLDYSDSDYKDYQEMISENVLNVAKSLPNTGVLHFATVLGDAYKGKENYVAIVGDRDNLRHTDQSRHMLNDAVFLNSVVLYQTLFGETPQIPQQLPLGTGTGDGDEIKLMDVSAGVSNAGALVKIAAAYK